MVMGLPVALAVGGMGLIVVIKPAHHSFVGSTQHDVIGVAIFASLQAFEKLVAHPHRVVLFREELQAVGLGPAGHLLAALVLHPRVPYDRTDGYSDEGDE